MSNLKENITELLSDLKKKKKAEKDKDKKWVLGVKIKELIVLRDQL